MTSPIPRLMASALALWSLLLMAGPVAAEVAGVVVASRTPVADGQSFGSTGPYERLVGRIEFALDPADAHNRGITDIEYAPRDAKGRVRFSADLQVLRPAHPDKGNGVLLFEVVNRGRLGILGRFNRAAIRPESALDTDVGDGLLMREGYTLVFVGWQADLPAPLLRLDAPPARLPAGADTRVTVEIMQNQRVSESFLIDDPVGRPPVAYRPADPASATDTLTVRDRYWDAGEVIPHGRWQFVDDPGVAPKIRLEGGFEPGRYYRVTYRASGAMVAGVGLAAIRDAAAAFRYRTDLPIRGRHAYAFGVSQTGRFLREFLHDGFNVDERGRGVFDAMWIHVAGAARGNFNERFATPSSGDMFRPTALPFANDELLARYTPRQRPKIFYTNTPVEYWGGGRAAALTHTTLDGRRDLALPDNVRMYLLSGTQHIVGAFPPMRAPVTAGASANPSLRGGGEEAANPTPQNNIMRALLLAWHQWAANDVPPPPSRYPRLADGSLVPISDVRFPAIQGVADPRRITGPAHVVKGRLVPLPHLVPQVDGDGNDLGGIRDPEVAVPLATSTGWNFRSAAVGNPGDIYQLLGSYIPLPLTAAARDERHDPRPSVAERYAGAADYLRRITEAANGLIKERLLLEQDLDAVIARAKAHWAFATAQPAP